MKHCGDFKPVLPALADGGLDPTLAANLSSHLESCSDCRTETQEYKSLRDASKALFRVDLELPVGVRTRIAHRAAEQLQHQPWWQSLIPLAPGPVLAAAVPALLLVLAVVLPLSLRSGVEQAVNTAPPVRIDMQVEGDGIRLAWSDGRERPYRVYKSTNPRQLGQGPGKVVRGNQWVDSEPDTAPIVFYRVE